MAMSSFKDFDAILTEGCGAALTTGEVSRPTVLVIDDDPILRSSLKVVLKDRYEVILCASAKEGVTSVHDDVCAAVLDVKMGRFDGFWACSEIRKKHPDIPVIFYSAYQDAKDPYDIINEHRPFGYIVKDGDISKLLGALDRAVSLHRIVIRNRRLIEAFRESRKQGTESLIEAR